ncbi:MAG: carbohydrate ABC transporter permease [Clostridiales bacterium]|nr:carbohydrate ABC transporter permease [Clostridiales bacterium]
MSTSIISPRLRKASILSALRISSSPSTRTATIWIWQTRILIIFFAVYTLFPLVWRFNSSLKTNYEFQAASPFALPAVPQLQNYTNALTVAGLGRMQLNSVIVGLAATVVNVIIASMGAYCISRFRFNGREKLFTLFTAGILVPLNALLVPYFVIINKLGLYNTYGGMILLYCAIGIPMSTFLIRGLMDSIPMELEEAAYIDGCGFFGRFFHIILPLSRTDIITAATFEFLTCWNEFVFASLIVSSEKLRTIQVGIRYFTNQFSTDYVSMYAAIMISIIPSIIGYILFQEQIIAGMTSGAVKG